MSTRNEQPITPALWIRHDNQILPLWWERLCAEIGLDSAERFAGGLFASDRRRPIAQWFNAALESAVLVALESSPEWPVQRFGVFYAPPSAGFIKLQTTPLEWLARDPQKAPTRDQAFAAAVASAEGFLQIEMAFL